MKRMRNHKHLSWIFATLFVVQLFVPMAMAGAMAGSQANNDGEGFVICTTAGLVKINPNGQVVPVSNDGNQQSQQSDCLTCLACGLCGVSFSLPAAEPAILRDTSKFDKLFVTSQTTITSATHRLSRVRAPPS